MGNTVAKAHKAFLRLPETAVGRALIPTAQSLRDVAYQCIKHLIVTGVLKPGDYINEATLSTRLDVGRTPVHQAIDRLVGDSLVEVIPRKGIVIKPLSLDEIFQTLDVRILNETAAAEKAGDNAGFADIEALRRLIDLFSQAAQKSDFVRMMYLDREFHLIIAHASGNPVLAEILRGIHDRSLRFWLTSVRAPMRYDGIVREHTAIVDAIVAREKQAASGAMRRHIESARDSLVRHMSMQIAV
ncbi:MAG: GntR family transcriptional regulator [Methylovirgula sp.]|uniref:GntR family transcriptional regulator n=1 Tax=Methylovirgula sp. TaxID=1978224 RepID=UPI0030765D83